MIYVEPCGGLCNRMRVIASAATLAEKYSEDITVIWRLDKGLYCNFSSLFCPIELEAGGVKVYETKFRYDFRILKAKIRSDYKLINCNNKNSKKIEDIIRNSFDIYIRTPHQFFDVQEYKMFKSINSIEQKAEHLISGNDNITGIHIRRTDNIKSIQNSPTSLFIEYMEREIQRNSTIKFFLASDSIQDKNILFKKFGDRIIMQNNICLSRNTAEGIQSACVDLLCLSKCNKIIGSYWSSFSETAAIWHGKKELIILTI